MNIVVLVKQVPNTSEVRIDPKTGNLIREGVESIMNPEDRHALEAAIGIKERVDGKVTVVSMGPPQAIDVICEAIAMGADKGILLSDRAFSGADTWATSTTLGLALRRIADYDLILAGRQAVDGDTAQIGPQVAEFLGIPQLTYVRKLDVREGMVVAERVLEDGCEHIEAPTPVLVTALSDLNEPRYPSVEGMIHATSGNSNIEVWNAADINVKVQDVGLPGSLTHVVRLSLPRKPGIPGTSRDRRHQSLHSLLKPFAKERSASEISMADIVIDLEKCNGCTLCARSCPYQAIEMVDKKAVWIEDRCTLCGACLEACKFEAISGRIPTREVPDFSDRRDVWVFVEQHDGVFHRSAFELIGCARTLADDLGQNVTAAVLGADIRDKTDALIQHGADRCIVVEHPALAYYQTCTYTHVLSELVTKYKPNILLIAATHLGRDLAPRAARRLGSA